MIYTFYQINIIRTPPLGFEPRRPYGLNLISNHTIFGHDGNF